MFADHRDLGAACKVHGWYHVCCFQRDIIKESFEKMGDIVWPDYAGQWQGVENILFALIVLITVRRITIWNICDN